MKKKVKINREDDETISGTHHGRAGAKTLVIFLHGFPKAQLKQNNFFGYLADEIPKFGASTLLFDYTSCDYVRGNTSEFTFETVENDLHAVYDWAARMGYDHIGIIAEGLGASFAVSYAPENCLFSIFCWPCFNLEKAAEEVFRISAHQNSLNAQGWFHFDNIKIGKEFINNLENTELPVLMNNFEYPSLILYGQLDEVFPPYHTELAREHLMAKRLEITNLEDGQHGLQSSSNRKCCMLHIQQFLDRYVKE